MPQLYNDAVITDMGVRLLNRAQAGEAGIQFTRIAVGDGVYTAQEREMSALYKSTALKSERTSYALSSIGIASDNSVKLTALITNQDPVTGEAIITEGYYINEMGLFAMEKGGDESTEVLYSITTTAAENGDYMPPYNGHSPAQIVQEYYATVSNTAEVSINLTGAGAALLAEVAEERFQELTETIQRLTEMIRGLQQKQERDRADIDYIALMRGVDL